MNLVNTLLMKQWAKMNKSYILDTNIILRLLLEDIPLQYKQARKIFLDAKNGKVILILPQIVVFEVNFALKKFYNLEKEEIIIKLESLISTDYIQAESKEIFIEALAYYRLLNISFVDCFLLSKTKLEKAELFTFDKRLKKIK